MLEDLSRSPLRIAVVAPPWFPIPPSGYGGIEAMVHALVEGLVDRGHDVVLVGAGTPQSSAKFLRTYEEAPLERMGEALPEIVHSLEAAKHLEDLEVDVVHDHSLAGPLTSGWLRAPLVMTAHGPISGDLEAYYRVLARHTSLVAISDSQRDNGSHLPWTSRVYGSVPEVVVDGVTGFICDEPDELPDAIRRVDQLDPKACRGRVFDCFDVPDMVEGYEAVYRRAILRASNRRS